MDGILVIDKPSGPTSHDMCQRVKRQLRVKKVGHAGTLDPLATGVLIILVGKATQLASRFSGADKEYLFTLRLGQTSDTYDAEGSLSPECPVPQNVLEQLHKLLPVFIGDIEQIVPAYSAVKHQGKPLYRLAREGKEVPLKKRTIRIHAITLESADLPELTLKVRCSAGTYVRSLAHDLGQVLGCGAYVTSLRRLRSEPFGLEGSVSWPFTELSASLLPMTVAPEPKPGNQ